MNIHRRAALLAVASSALAVSPLWAAEERVRVVGYLSNGATPEFISKRLAELGWAEGKNLRFEVRSLEGKLEQERIETAATELVRAAPDVILAFGALHVRALAARTSTIPIVCGGTPDPVASGLTKSIRASGTNITGISYGVPEQAPLHIGLMRTLMPGLRRIVMIVHTERIEGFFVPLRSLTDHAKAASIAWDWAPARTIADAEGCFARIRDARREIAYVMSNNSDDEFPEKTLAAIALRRRIVTYCASDTLVRAGGLMFYAIDHADQMGRIAAIIDKLLRGANPGETPFELPDRTGFVLNRTTAKALGIALPAELVLRATEIIG